MPVVSIKRPLAGTIYINDVFELPTGLGFPPIIIGINFHPFFIRRNFTINANATDAGCFGLAGVEFIIDSTWQSTVFFSPPGALSYSWIWTIPPGFLITKTLTTIAYDNAGNSAADSISVRTLMIPWW